jgi:hypothetical protein
MCMDSTMPRIYAIFIIYVCKFDGLDNSYCVIFNEENMLSLNHIVRSGLPH